MRITYDPEKFQLTLAKLTLNSTSFEVVVDPDAAVLFKEGKSIHMYDVLTSRHIYIDAQKGKLAPKQVMTSVFNTDDEDEVALRIVREGVIHFTKEYRLTKRKKVLDELAHYIHTHALDPRTGVAHPIDRIKKAFEEAKLKIDEFKGLKDQLALCISAVQKVLPLDIESKTIEIDVLASDAKHVTQYSSDKKIINDRVVFTCKLPGAMIDDVTQKIMHATQGRATIRRVVE
jgi:ribosome maturation protein SDO1